MKKISLFIMLVQTIYYVQASKNIVIYSEGNIKATTYNSVSTYVNNPIFDNVDITSSNGTNIRAQAQCTTQSWVGSALIPDNNSNGVSRTVTVTDTSPITDVNATIDITHTWDRDLTVRLTSPLGTTISLTSNNGGNGDNYTNTTFDDDSLVDITAGNAPFSGIYKPEQLLSSFVGEIPTGVWTITVIDNANFDIGTLNTFSLSICSGISNTPPTITTTGSQNYYPGSGNELNIATEVNIADSDDNSTNEIYIQISLGFVNGEDLLTLDNLAIHTANNIIPTWDAIEGKLTLTGPATYAHFEAAILDVLYSNGSLAATGTRQFSITIGEANFLPDTGHYYEFVSDVGISWTEARDAANTRTYFGLQGYLATITSRDEADFSWSQSLGAGWIGASDAASEGDWRWVTGPEAGTPFWNGGSSGSTVSPYNFAFWNTNEPNNWNNEDYAHITDVNVGIVGSWNDLPNNGGSGVYQAQGYVVEYGGTAGDPVINVTATTEINLINLPSEPNIMITQYYENGNNNDYVEIKNISDITIPSQTYYLAHFRRNRDINRAPNRNVSISSLAPGEVRTYNSFRLRGNDIVLISTSNGSGCYGDRVDIIGEQNIFWGNNRSLTKGGCSSESPHLNFDVTDWMELEVTKVDGSDNRQNIALGTYHLGTINWNGNQWSNGSLPDLSRITIIDDQYDADVGNIEACDLIINSDLNFDNNTTNSVILYRDLNINGTFTIGDQESLVMYDDNASILGNITKKEISTHRSNTYDFTYWSSPIESALIGNVFNGVTPGRIYLYDQSQSTASDSSDPTFWNTWVIAFGNMNPGSGYATEGLTGTTGKQNISFTGKPNNGRILVNIFENDDTDLDNDFNLIGNPYPSAINIEEFFDMNISIIHPTAYLWTHNTPISNGDSGDFSTEDYATYNYMGGTGVGGPIPDKNFGSSQGFFVRAINSGTAEFNNSMRLENANDQFFKENNSKNKIEAKGAKDRIWLNLTTDKAGFNQLLIGFTENATPGVDSGYDALKIDGGNSINFYSTIENEKYSIQGLNTFASEMTVDLGFDTKVAPRLFTISIDNAEGVLQNSEVYLVDKELSITHNLKESDYNFEVEKEGSNPNRFTLQFIDGTVLATYEENILNKEFTISQGDGLIIKSKEMVRSIKVFDVLGRKLIDKKPNKKSFNLESNAINKGTILIVEATLENNAVVSKKTIKY